MAMKQGAGRRVRPFVIRGPCEGRIETVRRGQYALSAGSDYLAEARKLAR